MSKKTSGIDDLISTLVKQHGLERSVDVARSMALSQDIDIRRKPLWRSVHILLKDMR
jgi:hypothetical protein